MEIAAEVTSSRQLNAAVEEMKKHWLQMYAIAATAVQGNLTQAIGSGRDTQELIGVLTVSMAEYLNRDLEQKLEGYLEKALEAMGEEKL